MGDKKKWRRQWQQTRHRNLPKAVPRAAADSVRQLKIFFATKSIHEAQILRGLMTKVE